MPPKLPVPEASSLRSAHLGPAGVAFRGTILVVDDDPIFLHVASLLLQKLGFASLCAGHASAALAHFEQAPDLVDLVLTDLNLPGASGMELVRKLREASVNLPVVVCTGNFVALRGELADWTGEILLKPFSTSELNEALLRALTPKARLA